MTLTKGNKIRQRFPIEMQEGDRFGRLTFVKYAESYKGARYGWFDCECGTRTPIRLKSVVQKVNPQQSCGCLRRQVTTEINIEKPRREVKYEYVMPNGEINVDMIVSPFDIPLSHFYRHYTFTQKQ